jgi:hypothetical protein
VESKGGEDAFTAFYTQVCCSRTLTEMLWLFVRAWPYEYVFVVVYWPCA